jgi:hypothetical protein
VVVATFRVEAAALRQTLAWLLVASPTLGPIVVEKTVNHPATFIVPTTTITATPMRGKLVVSRTPDEAI